MGYTHYFQMNQKADPAQWAKLVEDFNKLYQKHFTGLIQYESDKAEPPVINAEEIRFNGIGDDGHEPFYIGSDSTEWHFCKTANKPYDIAVCACLLLAAFYIESFEFSSDGFSYNADEEKFDYLETEWVEAIQMLNDYLDYDLSTEFLMPQSA